MKRRRLFQLALLLAVPVSLYFYIAERNSWRPQIIKLDSLGVGKMSFSPDGNYLMVGKDERFQGGIIVYNLHAHQITNVLRNSQCPLFLEKGKSLAAFSRFGSPILEVMSFPDLKIIKLAEPKMRHIPFPPDAKHIPDIDVWPDESTLAWHDTEDNIYLWNITSDKVQQTKLPLPPLKNGAYVQLKFLPDGKTIVVRTIPDNSGWKHKQFQFWDFVSKKRRFVVDCNDPSAQLLQALPNGLCILEVEGSIEIWDSLKGKRQYVLGKDIGVNPVFSPDGTLIASIDGDADTGEGTNVMLLDAKNGKRLRLLHSKGPKFQSLAFSLDGRTLACGSDSGFIQLWRVK